LTTAGQDRLQRRVPTSGPVPGGSPALASTLRPTAEND